MAQMTATTSPSEDDPFRRFEAWLTEARRSEPEEAEACALATASAGGAPSVRMVLLKGVDERGFVFYTNLGSRKATEIAENPQAALCFHWKSVRRQVRIEGPVEAVEGAEADAYFASRERTSQIGAWASKQSQPLAKWLELEKRVARFTARFHVGSVPRPDFWSGFRIVPGRFEFWESGQFRLHKRTVYERADGGWSTHRLYP